MEFVTKRTTRLPFRFWSRKSLKQLSAWGCGGNFTPEEYAAEYRRFTSWVPRYGVNLAFVGAGPNGGDLDWTRRFFTKLNERRAFGSMWGWAMHHYSWNVSSGRTTDWVKGKGDALNYSDEEWYELLNEADRIDSMISECWNVMGEFDRAHRVKLVVDEWGAWYKPGTQINNTHLLGQQSTIRDAVLAGQTLDTFHRHATLTGNNRLPNPDFGNFTAVSTVANGSSGTADASQPVRLTGNTPFITGTPINTALGTTPDGLVFANSLGTPGFAINIDGSGKVPYVQNWNMSFEFEAMKNLVVEVAYVGNKGTHLYMAVSTTLIRGPRAENGETSPAPNVHRQMLKDRNVLLSRIA